MRPVVILLLEDEPIIALDLIWRLERLGCRTLWADNPDDALAVCAQHSPDAALTNFRKSGGLDNMALARQLQARFTLPVLFLTGARPEDLAVSADYDAQMPVLYKPFTDAQLSFWLKRHGVT